MRIITNKNMIFGDYEDTRGRPLGRVPIHTTIDLDDEEARRLISTGAARPVPQPQVIFSKPKYETKVVAPRPFRDSDYADDQPALVMDPASNTPVAKPNLAERIKGATRRKRGRPRKSAG